MMKGNTNQMLGFIIIACYAAVVCFAHAGRAHS